MPIHMLIIIDGISVVVAIACVVFVNVIVVVAII